MEKNDNIKVVQNGDIYSGMYIDSLGRNCHVYYTFKAQSTYEYDKNSKQSKYNTMQCNATFRTNTDKSVVCFLATHGGTCPIAEYDYISLSDRYINETKTN